MSIEERFDALKEYLSYRIDIVSQDHKKWLGQYKNQLPSFEYFLENVYNDRNGKYDFTKRHYKTHAQVLEPIQYAAQKKIHVANKLYRYVEYSIWMNTPFNFKEKIICQ